MYEIGFPLGEFESLVIRRGDAPEIFVEVVSLNGETLYQLNLSLYTAVDFLDALRGKEKFILLEDKSYVFKFYPNLTSLVVLYKDIPTSVQLYSFDAYKIDFILGLWAAVLPEYKDRLGFDDMLQRYKNRISQWEQR